MAKKLYITTAIPYVNGKPHIGNALDYLLADIWTRYQKQHGRDVRFQVGTDEHGNKIAAKAAELNVTPKAYTDSMYGNFEDLMKKVGASYTDFIRTTDIHHEAAVQYIWQKLQPYIYKNTYEGWYCVGHEAFFTDKEATEMNGVCPDHQQPFQRVSEENYYLKASAFTDKIREAIVTNRMQIVPEFRKNEFLELIKDGVQDVSISRPKKNLTWGVPVPGDPEQIMYVWIDALANYITVLGYPDQEGWKDYWPADVQVIGKDILRFHAGIWPAMLLGLELPLPKKLMVHGFVNVGGAKMSKIDNSYREHKMGQRASPVGGFAFTDVRLPADALLGAEGTGFGAVLSVLEKGRLGIGALANGISRAALDTAIEHAGSRRQFGQPIGQFQAVAFSLADLATEHQAARLLLDRGAGLIDAGKPAGPASSMAKLYASEAAIRNTGRAVQVLGGAGFIRGVLAERLYRDARITTIYEGTSEVQRMIISRSLLAGR